MDFWPLEKEVVLTNRPVHDLGEVVVRTGLSVSGRVESVGREFESRPEVTLAMRGRDQPELLRVKPDGTFSIAGLTEGEYVLLVQAPGFEQLVRNVKAGESGLRMRLRAMAALTVEVAFPEGRSADGTVEIRRIERTPGLTPPWRRSFPSEQGSVRHPRLVPGDYAVRVAAGDLVGSAQVRVEPAADETVRIPLTEGAKLAGRVYRPGGELALDVGVELIAGKIWDAMGLRTDDRGVFRFPAVPAGEVTLRCHPRGHPPVVRKILLEPGKESEVEIRLAEGAAIELVVRDRLDRPFAGVGISLAAEDGAPARYWMEEGGKSVTGADGRLRLFGIAPGRYLLTLSVGSEWRERITLTLSEGETWNNEGRSVTIER
jgi:hypothetical protein